MIDFCKSCLFEFSIFATILIAVASAAGADKKTSAPPSSPQDVLTYHGDNLRTGWFSAETILNTGNVNDQQFGLLHTVPLDGRVDAEPLVAMQLKICGWNSQRGLRCHRA